MNEITQIHLGRQAFTISVDAHTQLRSYLDAIHHEVGDQSVVDEVELRMAELLAEHGITGDKVVLAADVAFLQEQLGDPKDFTEDNEPDALGNKPADGKQLYRDTDTALVAGVAAGLARYFNIDVLFFRIAFVLLTVAGGWGILVYIVLWLVVPEAKTTSDRLRMAGKPVTIDSLKEIAERADIKGAASRANHSLAGVIKPFVRGLLRLIGCGFIVAGLCGLFGLLAAATYALVNGGEPLHNTLFPVGLTEHILLYLVLAVAALISLFLVLLGLALFRRRWPVRAWITGVLVGLVFVGMAVSGALAADVVPAVHDRYTANTHTTVRSVQPFSSVHIIGSDVGITYRTASTYSVDLTYYGNPATSAIKTSVAGDTLTVDTSRFDWRRHCKGLCIPDTYNMLVTISSPNPPANITGDTTYTPPYTGPMVPVMTR